MVVYNVNGSKRKIIIMLLEKLAKKEGFTRTEQSVADYILNHGDDMVKMSVRQLADECYTAPNTIMRLCRKTGYDGFRDFKVALLKEMETAVYRDELLDASRPFYIGNSTSKIAHTMMTLQHQAVRDLLNELNYKDLEKTASLFMNARTIFIYGRGDSMIRGKSFMNKMFKINQMCVMATETHEEAGMSYNATSEDAALFISYRGGAPAYERCLQILKKKKCPSVLLSADKDTAMSKACDIWIHIPDRENSGDNIGTFYSQVCFDYILNLIYCLIYAATYTKNHNHKIEIDRQTSGK
ncbi:MAG: MurR/RpiR family transcriptional regulator [Erysipelotrichaceae bacterium]|nr:MurR/RpiR family transcriptional regulator [Erysipelotrichaceae bacterium]